MTVIKNAAHARRVFRDYYGERWPAVCSCYGYAMDHKRYPNRNKSSQRNEFSISIPRDNTIPILGQNELTPRRRCVQFRFRKIFREFHLEYSPECDEYGQLTGGSKRPATEADVISLLSTTVIPRYDWQLYLEHYWSRVTSWWFNISVFRNTPISKARRFIRELKNTRIADIFYYTTAEQVKRKIEQHYGKEWFLIQLAGHTGGWQIQPDDFETKWYAAITPIGKTVPWIIKVYEYKKPSERYNHKRIWVTAYREVNHWGTSYELGSRDGYANPWSLPKYLKHLDKWKNRDI